jgi:hypothetical protein
VEVKGEVAVRGERTPASLFLLWSASDDGGRGGDAEREQRRRWGLRQGRDGHGQVRAVHAGAGGGAGAGVRRVPQSYLRAQAAAAARVPHPSKHRAQTDQGLVPESKVSRHRC